MKLPKQLKWLRLPGGSVFSFWFRFARPFFMLLFVATLFIPLFFKVLTGDRKEPRA